MYKLYYWFECRKSDIQHYMCKFLHKRFNRHFCAFPPMCKNLTDWEAARIAIAKRNSGKLPPTPRSTFDKPD